MTRRPAKFKPGDVTKMVRAVGKAGERIERVEVDASGKIVVVLGHGEHAAPVGNPWDEVLTNAKRAS